MVERRVETSERRDAADLPGALAGSRPRARGVEAVIRTIEAGELLGSGGMLRIDLDGEIYTLRLTRNHRLILTK